MQETRSQSIILQVLDSHIEKALNQCIYYNSIIKFLKFTNDFWFCVLPRDFQQPHLASSPPCEKLLQALLKTSS